MNRRHTETAALTDLPLQPSLPQRTYGNGADRTALTLNAIYHWSSAWSNKSQFLITNLTVPASGSHLQWPNGLNHTQF